MSFPSGNLSLRPVFRSLIAAPVAWEFYSSWGCSGTAVGASGTAIGTGWANTEAIKASNCEIAAKLAQQLPEGWFIPSKDELNEMWEALGSTDINGDGYNNGPEDNCGGFAGDGYWSSKEYDDPSFPWFQSFYDGYRSYGSKYSSRRVRAVRAF